MGVNPRAEFSLATEADDSDIRRLLRENPMAGQISLSLEREPDYFHEARHLEGEQQTIVARDRGRVVCAGACFFRQRFVNGEPRRVGYLGGLRLDASVAGRFDILRRGYLILREMQRANPADFYFTAIAADNARARQFLERGLPGMPRYDYLGDFVTLLVPVPRARGVRPSSGAATSESPAVSEASCAATAGDVSAPEDGRNPRPADWETLSTLLEIHNCSHQFAPCWTLRELQSLNPLGLRREHFRVVRSREKCVACAALWDQRTFKQTVIRGYARPLAWARPWINFAARLLRRPGLPVVGSTLAHAAVSHLASPVNEPQTLIGLIRFLFPLARKQGIEWLTLGFAAADPRLATLRRCFPAREYRSRLYRVRWPDLPGEALDDRLPYPEVALL